MNSSLLRQTTVRRFVAAALSIPLLCALACASTSASIPNSRTSVEPFYEESEPGVMKRYNAYFVQPIEVCTIDDDYLRRVEDADARKLAVSFRSKLIKKLGDSQTTVPVSAAGVAFIEVTIADISTNYAALQLRPGILVPNAMRGGASIEARVIDSVSKRQVALFRDTRQGERQGFLSGLGKWDGAEKAFDEWAQLLASRVRS